jgi:hypothetical protein
VTNRLAIAMVALAACAGAFLGCSEDSYLGNMSKDIPPVIELTNGPFERSLVGYKVRFSWIGNDPDGRVDYYEFVICDGAPLGFNPADTTGLDKWHRTTRTDSTFTFTADEFDTNLAIGGGSYTRYKRTHTFFVRAVDNRGGRSEAAYRSFTAFTYAPYVMIDTPTNPFPGQAQTLPPVTKFSWRGIDPIDNPSNVQNVDSIRYMITPYSANTLADVNGHPERYELRWSRWIAYNAPGDSGTSTVIGDDELLSRNSMYMFAVQAKDEAGAITSVYSIRTNARAFTIFTTAGPLLKIREPYLGTMSYLGTNGRTATFRLPAGFVFHFAWSADASSYGGVVTSYRYGWDLTDLSDQNQWAVYPSPYVTSAPPTTLTSGVHTLYVEAVDNNGIATIGTIEITVFPTDMSRNLLMVDDFYSDDSFVQTSYAFPTESEDDAFWLHICQRAKDFEPTRDVFDTRYTSFAPPDMELVWKYKNVIWDYGSEDRVNAWDNVVRFTPESRVGTTSILTFNYLAYFMASGGHVWTSGKSDKQGGLCAVLATSAQLYPISFRCEITGPRNACDGDTSGVYCMAYKDYCVSVLDKVWTTPRNDSRMPVRRLDWDAMTSGYKDVTDQITGWRPGLPTQLFLWSEVTKPGRFFDPNVQGFTYVEVYNPGYWMGAAGAVQQSCFHPMYRMKSRNQISPMNRQVIAFWTTKYADVVGPADGCVAAPSAHFGIPLWFFNRAQVDSIADVIFNEWHINPK